MEPAPVFDDNFRQRMKNYKSTTVNKQSVSLKKHFMALLMKNRKVIGTDDCRRILKTLHPNFKSLNDAELSRFGQVLRYYVKAFPCWDELTLVYANTNGKADEGKYIDKWYTEFAIYLTLKMADAFEISKSLKDDKSGRLVEQGTQTEPSQLPNTVSSSYSIVLEGPPSLMYGAVFNISRGDVTATQHLTHEFSFARHQLKSRFINLPHVSIHGKFADIAFERKNVHEVQRFITMRPVDLKKGYSKRVRVERLKEEVKVSVYTLHLYTMYFRQFMQILLKEPLISDTRKQEFKLVIEEILMDMEEAFVGSAMPSNVKVTFTIGDNIYIRNKQTTMRDINYYEIITPKVALSLEDFDAKQDLNDKSRVTFESLNFFERNREHFIEHMNSSRLVFECLLCSKYFLSLFTIQTHFEQEHREEHPVMCGRCRNQIEVTSLVGNRWRHRCRGLH